MDAEREKEKREKGNNGLGRGGRSGAREIQEEAAGYSAIRHGYLNRNKVHPTFSLWRWE